MGDEDEGDAGFALDLLELQPHRLAQLEIERGERLVEQQHLRARRERPGERDPLLLTAGKLGRAARGEIQELDHRQHFAGAAVGVLLGPALAAQPEGDVFEHGHVQEQRVLLEHGVDRPSMRRQRRDVFAMQPDRAGADVFEPGDAAQERGLAAAGGSEEREELAVADRERDPVQGGHVAVAFDDPVDIDGDPAGARLRPVHPRPVHLRPVHPRPLRHTPDFIHSR